MALYDIDDLQDLDREGYLLLRTDAVKSRREKEVMKEIVVDRRICGLVLQREADGRRKLEDVMESDGEGALGGNAMVAVTLSVKAGKETEIVNWYRDEHIDLLSRVSGWRRSRLFNRSISAVDEDSREKAVEFLALHEYALENGLGGAEFQAATSTPWYEDIMTNAVHGKKRRTWALHYTFGPAPRELGALFGDDLVVFEAPDGKTRTFPRIDRNNPSTTATSGAFNGAAIESYVTARDGVALPFRLEGSGEPNAPLIVLSNSVLVDWTIWDGFVAAFFSVAQNNKYRILRYQTRGRSKDCGETPVTIDVLADDIISLLDAIRVPKAACLVGVSIGGATVLDVTLKNPERVAAFVSCDTNAKSPEGNNKAWEERIALADKQMAKDQQGSSIVGADLAEATVRRWFVKESYDGGSMENLVGMVKGMVTRNSLNGFKKVVEALYEYDLRDGMKSSSIKGAFLVGSGDGVLPSTMKEMARAFGNGADYGVIDGAGHLPMVEKPKEVADFVANFLNK